MKHKERLRVVISLPSFQGRLLRQACNTCLGIEFMSDNNEAFNYTISPNQKKSKLDDTTILQKQASPSGTRDTNA